MTVDIKQVLKKKKLTGEEVGRLMVQNEIESFKRASSMGMGKCLEAGGINNIKGLFTQAELDTMVDTLQTREDIHIYNCYSGLVNNIVRIAASAQSYYQMTMHGIWKVYSLFDQAETGENIRKYAKGMPEIMTLKQYEDARNEAIHEHKAHSACYVELICTALQYYLSLFESDPRKKNPIKSILKKYEAEPVTNKRIISDYNKIMGNGYYVFPNGKRKDDMPPEELLKEAMKYPYYEKNQFNLRMLLINKEEECQKALGLDVSKLPERPLPDINKELLLFWEKGIDVNAPDYKDPERVLTWKIDPIQPEFISKKEILEGFYDFYWELPGREDEEPLYNEFITDYPEVYKALHNDIIKQKGLEFLKDIKPSAYMIENIPYSLLYDNNIYDYKEIATCEIDNSFNGIAVLQQENNRLHDENGYYNHASFNDHLLEIYSFDRLKEIYSSSISYTTKRLILEGLHNTCILNSMLDICAEVTNMPDIAVFKIDIDYIFNAVEVLNYKILSSYKDVIGTDEEKEHKRKIIKEIFTVISTQDLLPTHKELEKMKAAVKDMTAFRGLLFNITEEVLRGRLLCLIK